MKKFNFLICYDIADPKRLSKIAKALEKVAIRIQKSLFFYTLASQEDIVEITQTLDAILNQEEDDIRIYKVDKLSSINLNCGINLRIPNLIQG
ncbi:MAG: CRISPR-associated endonuclease Cas2 [Sulfurimonas sp.]|nr:CRISPR-associated endonuclease Cas2 [Sulfurimonas sp.]